MLPLLIIVFSVIEVKRKPDLSVSTGRVNSINFGVIFSVYGHKMFKIALLSLSTGVYLIFSIRRSRLSLCGKD